MKEWLPGYVRAIADQLGLRDWRIELRDAGADGGKTATLNMVPNRDYGIIDIRPLFWEDTREDQRQTVIHECLHLHLHAVSEAFDDTVWASNLLSTVIKEMSLAVMERAEEHAVDAIAAAIAPYFPMPGTEA